MLNKLEVLILTGMITVKAGIVPPHWLGHNLRPGHNLNECQVHYSMGHDMKDLSKVFREKRWTPIYDMAFKVQYH